MPDTRPIVITGAAGLVGQNLIARLKAKSRAPLIAIDKHPANVKILARLHPEIQVIEADLATPGSWADAFDGAGTLVLNHAQIGALTQAPFEANNITATRHVLDAARRHGLPYIVHISSSVVDPCSGAVARPMEAVTRMFCPRKSNGSENAPISCAARLSLESFAFVVRSTANSSPPKRARQSVGATVR